MTTVLIEIEFTPQTEVIEAANRAVSRLSNHLEITEYRVEPLVRVDQVLVAPWGDEAAAASAFVYRIHLGEMTGTSWSELRNDFMQPLAQQGVAVREIRLAA
jgi:hypothetical protein